MYKLVVLCVFAAAVAEPEPSAQLLYNTPLTYASYPAVIPATTSISQQSSLIAHPSPIIYSHFIKKRSADPEPEAKPDPQLLSYSSSLYYPSPLSTPWINSYSGNIGNFGLSAYSYQSALPLTTHLIKKRSAQFVTPTTYLSSPYGFPSYNPNTYNAYNPNPYNAYNPYFPTTYLGDNTIYGQHLIKKRSAVLPLATNYVNAWSGGWPSTYYGNSYSALPYLASPYAYSTYIKK